FSLFFFQAEDGIRDFHVTGVQSCGPWCSSGGRSRCAVRGPSAAGGCSGRSGRWFWWCCSWPSSNLVALMLTMLAKKREPCQHRVELKSTTLRQHHADTEEEPCLKI